MVKTLCGVVENYNTSIAKYEKSLEKKFYEDLFKKKLSETIRIVDDKDTLLELADKYGGTIEEKTLYYSFECSEHFRRSYNFFIICAIDNFENEEENDYIVNKRTFDYGYKYDKDMECWSYSTKLWVYVKE